ncbi:uncharacterized protein LOC114576698 [Exaiptasia diaphana]|uniref:BRICHOS domain-containing protein n=1 Tax=Exaiptasia diaphana TaxID=2652724 RepID=A0A913YX24_EXADI|nr:uncharacterized protein LOC114576698 [Exaiptasia diaphana]
MIVRGSVCNPRRHWELIYSKIMESLVRVGSDIDGPVIRKVYGRFYNIVNLDKHEENRILRLFIKAKLDGMNKLQTAGTFADADRTYIAGNVVIKTTVVILLFAFLFCSSSSSPIKIRQNPKLKIPSGSIVKNGYVVEGSENNAVTMNDFKKKLSVIHIGAENTCYLSRLEKRTPTLKLKTARSSSSKTTTIWTIQKAFDLRSVLSKRMANLCSRSSIYWVSKIAETTTQSLNIGNKRSRRSQDCGSKICKKRTGFYKVNGVLQWVVDQLICITYTC